MTFAELIGKPLSVDFAFLPRRGADRTLISVRNRSLVHGLFEFIPDRKALRIKVRLEGAPGPALGSTPSCGQPSMGDSVGGGASQFFAGGWDALGPNVQSLFHPKGAPGDGGSKQLAGEEAPPGFETIAPPVSLPSKSPLSAVCSNMPARPPPPPCRT